MVQAFRSTPKKKLKKAPPVPPRLKYAKSSTSIAPRIKKSPTHYLTETSIVPRNCANHYPKCKLRRRPLKSFAPTHQFTSLQVRVDQSLIAYHPFRPHSYADSAVRRSYSVPLHPHMRHLRELRHTWKALACSSVTGRPPIIPQAHSYRSFPASAASAAYGGVVAHAVVSAA